MVKVRIHWRDGHYWAEEYSVEAERLALPYVDMHPDDWKEYQYHLSVCREWHELLRELNNEQFKKELEGK